MVVLYIVVACCLLLQPSFSQEDSTTSTPDAEPEAESTECSYVEHCDACENPEVYCETCGAGFTIASQGTTCLECPAFCNDCASNAEGSEAICNQCVPGRYWHAGVALCIVCPAGCSSCSGDGRCDECDVTYHRNTGAVGCSVCGSNCAVCSTADMCTECNGGFYIVDGNCQACTGGVDNCLLCEADGSECLECAEGFYWNSNSTECAACLDNCANCTDDITCTQCAAEFWKTGDEMFCKESTNCIDYADTVGCTHCADGYRTDSNLLCTLCPVYTAGTCSKCKNDMYGHWWDSDNTLCEYCGADCLDCIDSTACNVCRDGFYLDDDLTCNGCSDNGMSTLDQCSSCDNMFYTEATERCSECTSAALQTEEGCNQCVLNDQPSFWATGACSEVECSDVDQLQEFECVACANTFWDGSACEPLWCNDTSLLTNEAQCESCDHHVWHPGNCEALPDGMEAAVCVGDQDADDCINCQGHYWDEDTEDCKYVVCSSITYLSTAQHLCEACKNHYWLDNTCQMLNCFELNVTLATEPECTSCAYIGLFWDTGTDECRALNQDTECISVEDEVLCDSCLGYTWVNNTCAVVECVGDIDSESECYGCNYQYWDDISMTCTGSTCSDQSLGMAECMACPGRYYDVDNDRCETFTECANAEEMADSPEKCFSCQHINKIWDNGTCTDMMCPADDAMEGITASFQCLGCAAALWIPDACQEISCTSSDLPMERCDLCHNHGVAWFDDGSGGGVCRAVNCDTDNLDTANKCNQCDGWYYDIETCMFQPNCSSFMNSESLCSRCNNLDNDVTYGWSTDNAGCIACDQLCEVSCTAAGCTQCSEDGSTFLDQETQMCTQCSNVLDINRQSECSFCTGYTWHQNSCIRCPENCKSCNDPNGCDICVNTMIWHSATQMCVNCILDTTADCSSCFTVDSPRYLDSSLQRCEDCGSTPYSVETCAQCSEGQHFVDGSACRACSDAMADCVLCSSASTCEACPEAMFYDTGSSTCRACPANCDSCSSADSCDLCESNNYFTNGACAVCAYCTVCDTQDGCTLCNAGYYPNEEGICESCLLQCQECNNTESCDLCNPGYCWDAEAAVCRSNPGECAFCTVEAGGNNVICLECRTQYALDACQSCQVPHCKCTSGSSTCTECEDGYFLENNICSLCPDGCKTCLNADDCTDCMNPAQYWNDGSMACQDCSNVLSGCQECDVTDICLTCLPGYNMTNSQTCAECVDSAECLRCSDSLTECSECQPGFYITSGQQCHGCSTIFSHCSQCSSSSSCTACSPGWVLNDQATACIECDIEDCGVCMNPGEYCIDCDDAHALTEENECVEGCYYCDGETDCSAALPRNHTLEACPGLGTTHVCKSIFLSDNNDIRTVTRGCVNATMCPDLEASGEHCMHYDQSSECTRCCTDERCNAHRMYGPAGESGTSPLPMAHYLCIVVTLVMLMLQM